MIPISDSSMPFPLAKLDRLDIFRDIIAQTEPSVGTIGRRNHVHKQVRYGRLDGHSVGVSTVAQATLASADQLPCLGGVDLEYYAITRTDVGGRDKRTAMAPNERRAVRGWILWPLQIRLPDDTCLLRKTPRQAMPSMRPTKPQSYCVESSSPWDGDKKRI